MKEAGRCEHVRPMSNFFAADDSEKFIHPSIVTLHTVLSSFHPLGLFLILSSDIALCFVSSTASDPPRRQMERDAPFVLAKLHLDRGAIVSVAAHSNRYSDSQSSLDHLAFEPLAATKEWPNSGTSVRPVHRDGHLIEEQMEISEVQNLTNPCTRQSLQWCLNGRYRSSKWYQCAS